MVLRLIQKKTHLFLTQPVAIFCLLKDLKSLIFLEKKETLLFICNSLILSELPLVYQIYLFFQFNTLFSICYLFIYLFIYCTLRHSRFSDGGILIYCVILYINIYTKKKIYRSSVVQNYKLYSLVSLSSPVDVDQYSALR